ncbi:hypothetical protein BCR32DRAFT_324025 [Anaeromyces robustus]|uniref:Uncharacterized protein n=1 Tax=Anaeromyces robustus TaxID=1754192 RepID=A0A1Y1XR12_9FUNG|nr:hypothetical protein BCR32DRAFT_324025 [Anaeromyces robustus]|eukprot:ORX88201.1 hypothetical protein BCR32DRAFT_324025 [Anaeromyces robustus]
MNFKNVLRFTALTLLNIANAVPVTSGTKTLPSNPMAKSCNSKFGIPVGDSNNKFSCLIEYTTDLNTNNTFCFHNNGTILCIDEELNNIEKCKKEYEYSSEYSCFTEIYNLATSATIYKKVSIERPMISFPNNEKYAVAPRLDYKECQDKGGIVISYQSHYQYICFAPIETFESTENIHCATIEGNRYCVDENLTQFKYCNDNNNSFNKDACSYVLNEYATNHKITLEDIE